MSASPRKTSTISGEYFLRASEAGNRQMRVRLSLLIATACAMRQFRRDRRGASAIEFALVAIPFLMMMFAILETAVMFFAAQAMETATQDAARLIMTGQAQNNGMSASQFKTALCSKLSGLMNCAGGLDIRVKSFASFAAVALSNPVNNGVYSDPSAYEPGLSGNIVVVQAFYQWPLYVTGL